MKCPDCNKKLVDLWLDKGVFAWRCMRCGGFLMDSWTVSELKSEKLDAWRRIGIDKRWITGGKHVCPMDETLLVDHGGESMPVFVEAQRCARCGRWWFPGDALFVYKPAAEAKVNYYRSWNLAASLEELMLPIAVTVIILAGLTIAWELSQVRHEPGVAAYGGQK